MNERLASIAGAALLCVASSAAQANTSSASLKVSDLAFTVIDLVPGNAQLPSYQLFEENGSSQVSIYRKSLQSTTQQTTPGLFSPVSLTANDGPNVNASASFTATGFETTVAGTGTFETVAADAAVPTSLNLIRLAPGSAIFLSGHYEIALTSDCPAVNTPCKSTVHLDARIFAPYNFYDYFNQSSFLKELSIDSGSRTLDGVFGASYVNFSNQYVDLGLSLGGSVSVATVPEPAMWGLMAAGVLVAGMASRRQRGARALTALGQTAA